jgi:predicted transcriptional regulator of viral defense system
MEIERALGLLAAVKEKEISVKEAVELIELVTKVHVKGVLKAAEERGVITRDK